MVRAVYAGTRLANYSVERLNFEAAAVCEVDARFVIGGEEKPARLRWIREGNDGMAATPNQEATWRLVIWNPAAMLKRAEGHPAP
jgi:hypothetical protein